jgi:putative transposase
VEAPYTRTGRLGARARKINLSHVFAGQRVGIRQVDDHVWLVSFMHSDLGYFDDETNRLEPIDKPFGATVLPLRSGQTATTPLRTDRCPS